MYKRQTIGFAGTDYDTFLTNISNQKISYAKFDSDYVAGYKENKTDFDTVMKDITELFGLQAPQGAVSYTHLGCAAGMRETGWDMPRSFMYQKPSGTS